MFKTAHLFLLATYYAQVDAQLHKWFENLHSDAGGYCCAGADGIKVDDPSWGKDDQGYWVAVNHEKVRVPSGAVLSARNPSVTYAVVWKQFLDGKVVIRCFLPGTMT